MSKKQPGSVADLSRIVIDSIDRLIHKKASVNEVKTVIAGVNSVHAGLALRQEQARLSGARVNGDVIMDLMVDPNTEPSPRSQIIDAKPVKQLRSTKKRAA